MYINIATRPNQRDPTMTDAENIQRLLATFNDTLDSWNLHDILQVLQEHATIIRSMDVAKTNTWHWYPSSLINRLRAPKTQEPTWTYARLFQELQLNSRRSEVSDNVHVILHFILVLNEKLQELIQRSILYINPRHPNQYRILRSHEFNEAKNFELITRRHLRKKDGSILPWLGDTHKVIRENLCHFDDGEHSEDFVEFTEYIRATTTSIKTRFTQVANKIDKKGQELYQEPAILELKQEFLDKLWRPFLYRPSKPLMEPDHSPFDEQYAWHYTRVYAQCAASQSNRYEKWDEFVHDFNFRNTITDASDQHVFGYNLAEENGIRSTLERYYTLTWPEDDDVAEYPGFARAAHGVYPAVTMPSDHATHFTRPQYVGLVHPSHARMMAPLATYQYEDNAPMPTQAACSLAPSAAYQYKDNASMPTQTACYLAPSAAYQYKNNAPMPTQTACYLAPSAAYQYKHNARMPTQTACYLAPLAAYHHKHTGPKREYDFKYYLRSGDKKILYQQLDDEVKALISDFVNTHHISKYTWDKKQGSFRSPQNGKWYYETMTSNRRRYTMSGVEHNDPGHNDLVITGLRYGPVKVVPINR